jgi:hypothetical protein
MSFSQPILFPQSQSFLFAAASYLVLEFDRMNTPCENEGGAAVSNHDEEEGAKA